MQMSQVVIHRSFLHLFVGQGALNESDECSFANPSTKRGLLLCSRIFAHRPGTVDGNLTFTTCADPLGSGLFKAIFNLPPTARRSTRDSRDLGAHVQAASFRQS